MILSSNLSSKLEKLGVESTSGSIYAKTKKGWELWVGSGSESWHENRQVPAYYLSDLIRQSEKVFGKNQQPDYRKPCPHCGGKLEISNPTGTCNHVHYPENCEVCLKRSNGAEYHSHHITDLLLSNSSQEIIEEYILEAME